MKGHMIAAAVWLGLIAGGYAAFDYFGRTSDAVLGCEGGDGAKELVLPAARDGHFYLDGEVNGARVRFLVDTGASYVTINDSAAQAAGIPGGTPASFETAAGRVTGHIARGQRLKLACLEVSDVSVAVNPALGPVALLGQNVLRRFEVVQTRQQLTLRIR